MTHKEFLVLSTIATAPAPLTQRAVAAQTGMSVGSVNEAVSNLTEQGLVADRHITDEGLDALEPYRVKRAVLIAAGFGSRMVPITLNTPKPLVRVGGKRIIDTILDAVYAAGITEVYVVRGYLGEQFDQLLYKYPTIKLIDNPLYNEANNISSMVAAKDYLQSAYVFESPVTRIARTTWASPWSALMTGASKSRMVSSRTWVLAARVASGRWWASLTGRLRTARSLRRTFLLRLRCLAARSVSGTRPRSSTLLTSTRFMPGSARSLT